MKRIIPPLVFLLIGLGVGWYFGYTRPMAKNQRELLRQYEDVKNNVHMTDAEMAEIGSNIPQFFQDMKRQDEMAAVFALGTFQILEQGNTDQAKAHLLKAVGSHYRLYHDKGGDTTFITTIEEAAEKHPAVAAEISK